MLAVGAALAAALAGAWLGAIDDKADGVAEGVDVQATSAMRADAQIAADFLTR
jgi:hypothetical protein